MVRGRDEEELKVVEVLLEDRVLEDVVSGAQAGAMPSPAAKGWTSTTPKSIQEVDTKKFCLSGVNMFHFLKKTAIDLQLIRHHLGVGKLLGKAGPAASA